MSTKMLFFGQLLDTEVEERGDLYAPVLELNPSPDNSGCCTDGCEGLQFGAILKDRLI